VEATGPERLITVVDPIGNGTDALITIPLSRGSSRGGW